MTSSTSLVAFSAFIEKVKAVAWPEGVADNLDVPTRNRLINCLIQLQTYVKCLRNYHVNYLTPSQMTNLCGASQFSGPRGEIQALYSFLPGTNCKPLTHRMVSMDMVQCVISASRCSELALPYETQVPYVVNYPYNGEYFCADQPVARDYCYEAADKMFAVGPGQKFVITPQLPCGYVLAVHWNGVKRSWDDSDLITADEDVISAVAKYVRREAATYDDGDLVLANALTVDYNDVRADLHHRCREETRTRETHLCLGGPDFITGFFLPLVTNTPDADFGEGTVGAGAGISDAVTGEQAGSGDIAITTAFQNFLSLTLPAGTYIINALAGIAASEDAALNSGGSHIVGELHDGSASVSGTTRNVTVYSDNDGQLVIQKRVILTDITTISLRLKRDISVTDFPSTFKGAYSAINYIRQ